MNRLLVIIMLMLGCDVPVKPLPPTEVDRLAQQYNAVVVARRDLESGVYQTHARLLDDSQVWRSSGRNVTDSFSAKIGNAASADRQLVEAMRMGVTQ